MRRILISALLILGSQATHAARDVAPTVVTELATLATPARAGSVVFAKTGRLAAAECADGKLRIWTLPDGRLQREIDLGPRQVDNLALTDDGSRVAVADHDGLYTIWDTTTGTQLVQQRLTFYTAAMTFSHDGRTLAIAPSNDPVQLIDAVSGKQRLGLLGPVGGTTAIAFSRDDRRLATSDADTVVRVYDARSGALVAKNTDFLLEPLAIDFSADGRQVLAAGADNIVDVIDAKSGHTSRKSVKEVDPIVYLEASRDGHLLATGLMHAANMTSPAPIVISEMASGRRVQEWLPQSRVHGGTWTTDGRLIVATAAEKALHIWRVR
jgi:WD40 repeat protein